MIVRRASPYVYTTWLSKLPVGDQSCKWATWFKANYQGFEKAPSSLDAAVWRLSHTALLDRKYRQLIEAGHVVSVEGQNKFSLRGKCATLGGKPDLISLNGKGTVYDVKTGQPRPSDHAQVMIYIRTVAFTESEGYCLL